jgi:ribosomal protein S16
MKHYKIQLIQSRLRLKYFNIVVSRHGKIVDHVGVVSSIGKTNYVRIKKDAFFFWFSKGVRLTPLLKTFFILFDFNVNKFLYFKSFLRNEF